jgi:hypothetical protein
MLTACPAATSPNIDPPPNGPLTCVTGAGSQVALLAVGLGTLVASPPVGLAIVFVIAMTRRGQRLLFGARLTNRAPRHTDRVSGGRPAAATDARPPLSRR